MYAGGFDQDEFDFDYQSNPTNFNRPRKAQYNNAYGNYRGGYRGGFAVRRGPPPALMDLPGPPFGFFGPPGPPGPYGPRGPPFRAGPMNTNGRNPVDEKTVRFLMRCGFARDAVRTVPRDVIRMIEPNRCGLCDVTFNSFNMSKLHYLSKNHAKSQKKYLALKPDLVPYKTKEIPFKSRDLYCELCDVHITSKSHAESHYSGKPHRAIVEGRKISKNPMLLQNGMQDRLNQLIRREKKNLKADAEKAAVAPKDAKQPDQNSDLYCKICKTWMTCTEQMTMHLNGKKHLTKEKQHILNMMKGEEPNDNTDQGDGADAAEKDSGEAAEEEADEEADEDEAPGDEAPEEDDAEEEATAEDWENNGEKWE